MFGKKNKATIDLQDDKEKKAMELAALEASLDFLKKPAKPAEEENPDGEAAGNVPVTAADRARAQKFGRRMDYKTAVVRRGSNNEEAGEAAETAETATETEDTHEGPALIVQEIAETDEAETETETEAEQVTAEADEPVIDTASEDAETQAEASVETSSEEENKETEEEKEKDKEEGLIIAEAPVPETGEEEPVKLIENPLPTPKKHVPKEMDFDIEPDPDHMHFDVVDMKGKDFFDI